MGYHPRAHTLLFRTNCKHVTVGVGQHRNRSIDFRRRRHFSPATREDHVVKPLSPPRLSRTRLTHSVTDIGVGNGNSSFGGSLNNTYSRLNGIQVEHCPAINRRRYQQHTDTRRAPCHSILIRRLLVLFLNSYSNFNVIIQAVHKVE